MARRPNSPSVYAGSAAGSAQVVRQRTFERSLSSTRGTDPPADTDANQSPLAVATLAGPSRMLDSFRTPLGRYARVGTSAPLVVTLGAWGTTWLAPTLGAACAVPAGRDVACFGELAERSGSRSVPPRSCGESSEQSAAVLRAECRNPLAMALHGRRRARRLPCSAAVCLAPLRRLVGNQGGGQPLLPSICIDDHLRG